MKTPKIFINLWLKSDRLHDKEFDG